MEFPFGGQRHHLFTHTESHTLGFRVACGCQETQVSPETSIVSMSQGALGDLDWRVTCVFSCALST